MKIAFRKKRTDQTVLSVLGGLLLLAAVHANAQRICDVRQYGAKGDGITKDTTAIQDAIDACGKGTGGTVRLSDGTFVSGPIELRSNIVLDVTKGSILAASTDHDDFPNMEILRQPGKRPFIRADYVENIVITGGGVIDGRGQSWWANRDPNYLRPRLIIFQFSKHIRMEDITVENSPSWQIVPYYSDDLTFRNMRVLAPEGVSHNTDGIDPFSSSHVLIDHVLIDTGDDNVAIKSGQPGSPGPDAPSHDIVITDCEFLHGHGLSIGSEVSGGVRNVRAERIHFKGTGTGIRIKSNRDRGSDIGNLVYRDLVMKDVATPILISEFYPKIPDTIEDAPITRLTPHFHDITIQSLRATGAREAAVVVGLPESPIRGLDLTNVNIDAKRGAQFRYADVHAKQFVVHAVQGSAINIGASVHGDLPKPN